MNEIDDDIEPELALLLDRTSDDFGLTVSANKMSEEVIEKIHQQIIALHK